MKHVKFGRSGLMVSQLCLGTMTFGLQCDEAQSRATLDAASEGGIDFLDTADVYRSAGTSARSAGPRRSSGAWLQHKRHDFILATKYVGRMGPKRWDHEFKGQVIRAPHTSQQG